jgi:NADH dehydrogenase FAD-containing subunit
MSRKKVLVLGGNFAGLTGALAVRHELHGDVDVRVVSASDKLSPSRWARRSSRMGSTSCTPRPPRWIWTAAR